MKILFVLFTSVILFAACNKSDNNSTTVSGKATMSVYLTDGPGPYDAIMIDLRSIEVNSDSSDNGWKQLDVIHPGVYNLFHLRNGLDTLIASGELPAGKISQIRLILGPNNSVIMDGVSYPLETPSAQQSGIKLNVDAQLTAGVDYKIWTDFDGDRSIVRTGNNKFILKPVIRVYTKAISGSVKGIVLPTEVKPWVYAINGSDTIASAQPDSTTGNFLINGLAAGSYSIAIDGNNNYNDTTYNNVNVTTGSVTDIGTVQLHQ